MGGLKLPAESLAELAIYTLKHAFYSLGAGDGVLVPFVMADSDSEGRILHRFGAGTPDRAKDRAHQWLDGADPAIVRYAFAWDGHITIDEVRCLLLCQRYEPGHDTEGVNMAVGEPMLVDKPGSRLQTG
jgi:hypothetical protein